MPRYFFDTNDGQTLVPDERGYDLRGPEAARRFAQDALADMARDVVPADGPERTMSVWVRDEAGNIVLRATLVLRVEMGVSLYVRPGRGGDGTGTCCPVAGSRINTVTSLGG